MCEYLFNMYLLTIISISIYLFIPLTPRIVFGT